METLTICKPFDIHVHPRRGPMMMAVMPLLARYSQGIVAEPNASKYGPAIKTAAEALEYRHELAEVSHDQVRIISACMLTDSTTREDIEAWSQNVARVGKLYPAGVTTGSAEGVTDPMKLKIVFANMWRCSRILSIHCEMPGSDPLQQEQDYLPTLRRILDLDPRPRVIVEHISSRKTLELLSQYRDGSVFGTIMPQHLLLTKADVFAPDGTIAYPHNWCKPVAKEEADREALIEALFTSEWQYCFASDFAPHPEWAKLKDPPAAGCANYPAGLLRLVEICETHHCLEKLEDLTSTIPARIYGINAGKQTITLDKKPFVVPEYVDLSNGERLRLWQGGQELSWSLRA